MKKVILPFIFIAQLAAVSFAAEVKVRYIVFFAESSDIAEKVVDKILFSKRFCMTVPVISGSTVAAGLEELVSRGRIEPSLVFEPEPVFPILATVYSSSEKKVDRLVFNDFIAGGISAFENSVNKEKFGLFLRSGEVSHNILYYFAGLKLSWINVDNMKESFNGVYDIDGIVAFSIYKNFPTAQKNVMKWLESKKENIIPVLITKRHLRNEEFMEYIIELFDRSKYIIPAVPLYVSSVKREMIPENKSVSFELLSVKPDIMTKLYYAFSFINDYRTSADFLEYSYRNAQSELLYLCSYDILKGVSSNKVASRRMFDAAYNNIYRLLGAESPSDKELSTKKPLITDSALYMGTEEVLHTEIFPIEGGVSINNDGILKNLTVLSKEGRLNISFSFEGDIGWDEKVSYFDIYIDMNNFEGAGSTSMMPDINGYLTPDSAWEYALRVNKDKILLYRHTANSVTFLAEIQNSFHDLQSSFSVLQKYIRGNPSNWGYQIVAISGLDGETKIVDFFVNSAQNKDVFLSIKPFQIPAIRLRK